jgi:Ca2+-binding RTX toxin-like protein
MTNAWALTNEDLDGFGVNRPDGSTGSDGTQFAPVVADNGAEFFAVAWLSQSEDGTTHMRAQFYDALGRKFEDLADPEGVLAGPVNLDDGVGHIVTGPVMSGWVEGYTAVWGEQASEGPPSIDNPVLLRARATGPEALLGPEFSIAPVDPEGPAVIRQYDAALTGWERIIDEDLATEREVVGFSIAWVEEVVPDLSNPGATMSRIMFQRYEVPLDETGAPQFPQAAGIDGIADADPAQNAPIDFGPGRSPSVASLHDGQQVLVWVDPEGNLQGRFWEASGDPIPIDIAAGITVADGQMVRAVGLGLEGFGIFWVQENPATGELEIWGRTWSLPDGAANWVASDPTLVAAPGPNFSGQFSAVGFGEGSDAGLITYGTTDGKVYAQAFEPDATPDGAPYVIGDPGASQTQSGAAGLIGERAVVVWRDEAADSDIRAQFVDVRTPGQVFVGDRDRGDGRVDERPDVMIGTVGDDLFVTDRGDTRRGRQEDDQAWGGMGDDTMYGGGGVDTLDGGEERVGDAGPEAATDIDSVVYRGSRQQYSVTMNGDGSFTVKDMRTGLPAGGSDGQDIAIDFEQFIFGATINGPTLNIAGADSLSADTFFQVLPEVTETDGTPMAWGLTDTSAFQVNDGAGETAGPQHSPVAVALEDSFAFVWQSGNQVLLKAYDPLGRPDAAFGGGAGATVFTLTDGSGIVSGLTASMAGDLGVVAAWLESATEGGPTVVKGRFASSIEGIIGDEFEVPLPITEGYLQRDIALAGYEVVDAANDTTEFGFHLLYTEAAGSEPSGRILFERFSLFRRTAPGQEPDEDVPVRVGLDGLPGTGDEATVITESGRDASATGLHDGELVVSWIETSGGIEELRVRIFAPELDAATDVTSFGAVQEISLGPVPPGATQSVLGLGFNFAAIVSTGSALQLRLYTGSGGIWSFAREITLDTPGGTGAFQAVPTDEDGGGFVLYWEQVGEGGVTHIIGQRYDADGDPIGQRFTVYDADTGLPAGGTGGFSAAGLADGRLVVAAEGQANAGADPDGIVGRVHDTRTPGEQIIGPRDGDPPDLLVGTAGDDAIDGRFDNDELYGGLGNDFLAGGSESDTLFGGMHNDTLLGGSEQDLLFGEEGDDLLLGGFGADTLDGGTGRDTASYHGEFARFIIDLQAGQTRSDRNPNTGATLANGAFAVEDQLIGIENAVGGEGADTLIGNGGDNVLQGRGGNDVIQGGAGADTISYAGETGQFRINLATGITQSQRGAGGFVAEDSFSGIENAIGGEGADTITGDAGDNILQGRGGRDLIQGGDGGDTISYAGESGRFHINLAARGTWSERSEGAGLVLEDSFSGIEHARGGEGRDSITGDAGANRLEGAGGDDTISGGLGQDTMDGGEGTDTLSYAAEAGRFRIDLAAGQVRSDRSTGGAGALLLEDLVAGFENVVGSAGADTINGSAAANVLEGGAGDDRILGQDGDDTLQGGTGADSLFGGSGNDTVTFRGESGRFVIDLALGTTQSDRSPDGLGPLAAEDLLSGFENAIGAEQADTIIGSGSANTLEGRGGDDSIDGGGGHDWIDGGAGNNRLFGGTGNDTLYSGGGNDLLMGGDGHDRLSAGGGADTLFGEAGNDLMYGGGGSDELYGGTGADSLYGGLGNDLLRGEAGNDRLSGEEGDDTLLGGADADVLYGGAGNDLLLGEGGADSLWGGAGNDLLEGGDGNDRLSGEDGADTLSGGVGQDSLYGGAGADAFLFGSIAEGGDAILDFDPLLDSILISASGFGIDPTSNWLVINTDGSTVEGGQPGSIVYNQQSGWLWWDSNGSAFGGRELIARLSGAPALDPSDFILIA